MVWYFMEDIKKKITEALNFRHACKEFNGEKIPNEDLKFILESGRLSPSSFGMQPWKFIVVKDQKLKEQLLEASLGQIQVTTCSDLVVICARTDIKPSDDFFKKVMENRTLPEEKQERIKKSLDEKDPQKMLVYCQQQAFIALGNMMQVSAFLGVDSCPMGGFDAETYSKILGLDPHIHPTLLMPLGYRKNKQSDKERLAYDDVVETR
tara:strand:+ start:660 stop:1283 length:624 start_codon:yes stop_codon:yes gene_type:complete